ncbi:MAG: helix-turn-helix domain-containing protein [Acidobacteriota bacterium]|nr:helix-turn-helix domain-containing protein [Acidobacteriota bacterium]
MPPSRPNRWTPIPNDAARLLLSAGRHHAFIVLWFMLTEATENKTWIVAVPVSRIMRETALSKGTVRKAQRELEESGLITRVAGAERQTITYRLRPIENYGTPKPKQEKDTKPTGEWTL